MLLDRRAFSRTNLGVVIWSRSSQLLSKEFQNFASCLFSCHSARSCENCVQPMSEGGMESGAIKYFAVELLFTEIRLQVLKAIFTAKHIGSKPKCKDRNLAALRGLECCLRDADVLLSFVSHWKCGLAHHNSPDFRVRLHRCQRKGSALTHTNDADRTDERFITQNVRRSSGSNRRAPCRVFPCLQQNSGIDRPGRIGLYRVTQSPASDGRIEEA